MPYNDIKAYYNFLKSMISHPKVTNHHHIVRVVVDKRNQNAGTVFTPRHQPLLFADGASLSLQEDILLVNREIQRVKYSYHYERGNDFFRYDKDPSVVRVDHSLCHLHAHQEEPRFPSHETSLEEVFQFIIAVYY
jgi:hypothetical protein